LEDDVSINKACNVIQKTVHSFPYQFPHHIELNGIHSFQDNIGPRIYYAEPKANEVMNKFHELAHQLVLGFQQENLNIVDETETFHITLFRRSSIIGDFVEPDELKVTLENAQLPLVPVNSVALCIRYSPLGQFSNTNTERTIALY
jgi:2'-5' RNA ligase